MESYYGLIFMKRIWGCPGRPHSPLGSQESLSTPLGTPGTPLGPRARPWDPLGTSLTLPRDVPGTTRNLQGPLIAYKKPNITTNIQHQKLSIAVFEPGCWDPLPEEVPRAILSIIIPVRP